MFSVLSLILVFWIFVNALQQNILYAFKKILVSLPALLRVFREEGIWDLIFSENFFYFGPSLEELPGEFGTCIAGVLRQSELCSTRNPPNNQLKFNEVKNLQIEIISFVEYVATISGNSHNLVCSSSFTI
ncbi:hypothetical protein GIB67_029744 [Kingdonia uniflora]|uniref:Uncharacterized protein n=1 Tax=Kingdonia uniflora TaxID=39325 RepID=A0A7J7LLN0_9MAGN|nr:hypothetical protein GIB67_029744 [Kingdonia uniflora]